MKNIELPLGYGRFPFEELQQFKYVKPSAIKDVIYENEDWCVVVVEHDDGIYTKYSVNCSKQQIEDEISNHK